MIRAVLTASIVLKNGVFWVVTPCGSCKNRRFGGTWRLLHQGVIVTAVKTSNLTSIVLFSLISNDRLISVAWTERVLCEGN
jgi:hypothetical protein